MGETTMQENDTEAAKSLAGVWRLMSSEFRGSSGDVMYPLGEDATGQVIFTESGYMSAQLMRQGRPVFAAGDQASGTDQEIIAAFHGYVAYYGSCKIDVKEKTLTTDVEGSMYPNWVGGKQLRYYELTDQTLLLKTPPLTFGEEEIIGVLTWERV
jgi:hypothetical protein